MRDKDEKVLVKNEKGNSIKGEKNPKDRKLPLKYPGRNNCLGGMGLVGGCGRVGFGSIAGVCHLFLCLLGIFQRGRANERVRGRMY